MTKKPQKASETHTGRDILSQAPTFRGAHWLIRHAAREPVRHAGEVFTAPLTTAGRAEAFALGVAIANEVPKLLLSHSPVFRCEDTASHIASGFASVGGEVMGRAVENRVGGTYLIDIERAFAAYAREGETFLRAWFDGTIEPDVLMPVEPAAREQLTGVLSMPSDDDTLCIAVSHDWNIATVREAVLGLRHEDIGWVGFLDGVSVRQPTAADKAVRVHWGAHAKDWHG